MCMQMKENTENIVIDRKIIHILLDKIEKRDRECCREAERQTARQRAYDVN